MMKSLLPLSVIIFCACGQVETRKNTWSVFRPGNDSLSFSGRVKIEDDSATIYWAGSGVTFRFQGKAVRAWLRDETSKNYFNVVIDDSLRYFRADSVKKAYLLAENLRDTIHTVSILKRADWDRGKSWFYGIAIDGGKLLPPPPKSGRVIEFFGNSITTGYANQDNTGGDSPDGPFTNNYRSYAAITARHFNADYYCTSRHGIGVMVSWFPQIMPEVYDRLDPADPASKWDFSKVTPDVVVINLFQNDSWIIKLPDHESFRQRFGKKAPGKQEIIAAYKSFVASIRKVYPDTYIICALGNMDATKEGSPWPGYVSEAVAQLEDPKIMTHFFPYMNKDGHPRVRDHEIMAESLISFIEKNIQWQE